MEQSNPTNEKMPMEKYSFKFEANEIKKIYKKPIVSLLCAFIFSALFAVVLPFVWLVFDMPKALVGISFGIFALLALVALFRMLLLLKAAKATILAMPKREYVYWVYDDKIKLEIFDGEERIIEEIRKYSEIRRVADIKTHLLLTIVGRTFIVRKSDLTENSLLLTVFNAPIKADKIRRTVKNVALIVVLVCTMIFAFFEFSDKINEKIANRQAIAEMKAAISQTYDEYELLTHFNVYKDGEFIDSLIVIESNGKVDVLGYASQDGEHVTVEKFIGLTPELGNVIGYLYDGSGMVMRIYTSEKDIPSNVSRIEEIQYGGEEMYFCVTYLD